jgi:hypothetical protein
MHLLIGLLSLMPELKNFKSSIYLIIHEVGGDFNLS